MKWKTIIKNPHIDYLLLFVFSFLFMAPLIAKGFLVRYSHQDMAFHITRLYGLSNVWKSPINFLNYTHNGPAVNLFYPWLLFYPAYLIFALTHSMFTAFMLYYGLLTFLTMVIAYKVMISIKHQRLPGLLFALFYGCAGYRVCCMSYRAAVGETIALTFLPLLLLGVYEITRRDYHKWYILTIGLLLIAYAHTLSFFMSSLLVGFSFLALLIPMKDRGERIFAFMKSMVFVALMYLPLLFQMIDQVTYVKLVMPFGYSAETLNLANSLVTSLRNFSDYNPYSLGLTVLVLGAISLLLIRKLNKPERIVLLGGVLLYLMTTDITPWHYLNGTVFAKIQFAWRLTGYATLLICFSGSILLSHLLKDHASLKPIVLLFMTCLVIGVHIAGIDHMGAIQLDDKTIYTDAFALRQAKYYENTDYINMISDDYTKIYTKHVFRVNGKKTTIAHHQTASAYTFDYENKTSKSVKVAVPVFFYRGQKVSINGAIVSSTMSRYGATQVTLSPGKNHVVIYYEYTSFVKMGWSIGTISALLFAYAMKRIKGKKDLTWYQVLHYLQGY